VHRASKAGGSARGPGAHRERVDATRVWRGRDGASEGASMGDCEGPSVGETGGMTLGAALGSVVGHDSAPVMPVRRAG